MAEAACPDFPEVPWWGEITHEGVVGYVNQKHGGEWAGYLDKWRRQLAKVRTIHSQGKGIKIPSSGQTVKGQPLADYITKLNQRVEINECLSKEKGGEKSVVKKKTQVRTRKVTPYGEGVIAYKAGDFKIAHDLWIPIAKSGNPKAQNALGLLYRKGLGVDADIEKSRQWYSMSATQGDPVGLFSLGDIGLEKASTKEDTLQAIKLILNAAKKNYSPAQYSLAVVNHNGKGVEVNNAEAYFWAILAEKNKFKKATALLEKIGSIVSDTDKAAQAKRAEEWLTKNRK